ncbi:MAG: hypothetical protein IKU17_00555 [Clostridia bacterium]|nr:hypothetical protein [Clostridia bacterium]
MEETRSSGELIDSMDDLLVQLALRRTMRKRTAALAALVKQTPGVKGFSNGMTAVGRRRVKTCVLAFCAGMVGLFFWWNHVPWGVAVAAALLAVAVLLGLSAAHLHRKACFVLYDGKTVRLVGKTGERSIPYNEITEAHIHEDLLALCMKDENIVLTAGAAENLQEMQIFMEHLAKAKPGRVYFDDPVDDSEDE